MPVNIASKLGEDVAEGGEIIVEQQADAMLPDDVRARYARRLLNAYGVDAVAMTRR